MLVLAQTQTLGPNLVSNDPQSLTLHDSLSPTLNSEISVDKWINKHTPSHLHQRPCKEEHLLMGKRRTEKHNGSLRMKYKSLVIKSKMESRTNVILKERPVLL